MHRALPGFLVRLLTSTSLCRSRPEHREKRGARAQRFACAGGSRSPPPAGTGKLLAQQTQPGDQGWSQNDQSNGQYAPNQQSEPPSDYGQQSDTQRSYPDSGQTYPQRVTARRRLSRSMRRNSNNSSPRSHFIRTRLWRKSWPRRPTPVRLRMPTAGGRCKAMPPLTRLWPVPTSQNWDPSVKALTAFPQVLAQMDRNLQWTTDLGNAYYNQPQDVLQAVQVMRRRAQAAGTLQSTPQQAVDYDQGYVQLIPVNPQVVYVPTYNPWTVYGEQVSPYPGFSLLGAVESFLGSSPINYGLGIAMNAFSHMPWGWLAWGLNWFAQSVLFNQSNYYSHSTTVADWGFQHDGLHAYAGRGAFAGHSYGRTSEGFRRFGDGHNGNRGHGFARSPGRYAENWRGNSNAGFHAFGIGYDRAPRQAHNYLQAPVSRQQFARDGYGSSWNRGTGEGHRSGARPSYDRSMQAHRAPASGFQRERIRGTVFRGFREQQLCALSRKTTALGWLPSVWRRTRAQERKQPGLRRLPHGRRRACAEELPRQREKFRRGALAWRRRSLRRSRRRQASPLKRQAATARRDEAPLKPRHAPPIQTRASGLSALS